MLRLLLMNAIGLQGVDVIMAVTFLLTVFALVVSSIVLAIDRELHPRDCGTAQRHEESIAHGSQRRRKSSPTRRAGEPAW